MGEFYKMYVMTPLYQRISQVSMKRDVANDEISIKEVASATRSLKCGKATSAGGATAAIIKYLTRLRVLDLFWILCNLCWKLVDVTDDWQDAVIMSLYEWLSVWLAWLDPKGCSGRPKETLDLDKGVWIRFVNDHSSKAPIDGCRLRPRPESQRPNAVRSWMRECFNSASGPIGKQI